MLAVIEFFVEPVSTFAWMIDQLVLFNFVVIGFWFILTEGVFFYFVYKYRWRDGTPALYVTGKEKHLKRWVAWPHYLIILCDVFIVAGAIYVWYHIKQDRPEPDYTVRIIAQQWAWSFVHPGADGQLDTDDDIHVGDELHIVANKTYHFKLESRDVQHSFSVPAFRLKQDAWPGREITGWFEATKPGEYDIQCTEMCGIGHGLMPARLYVETPDQHADWVKSQKTI